MLRLKLHSFLLVMLLVTWSCAGIQSGVDTESVIKERATAYWQHKIKGELAEAYLFEAPDYREKISLTDYIASLSGGMIILNASVKSVSIKGSIATVPVRINYVIPGAFGPKEGIPNEFKTCWHLHDGVWYHRIKTFDKKVPARKPQ